MFETATWKRKRGGEDLRFGGNHRQSKRRGVVESAVARTHFSVDRAMEFFTVKELVMHIGHPPHVWPVAILKELTDSLHRGLAGVCDGREFDRQPKDRGTRPVRDGVPEALSELYEFFKNRSEFEAV